MARSKWECAANVCRPDSLSIPPFCIDGSAPMEKAQPWCGIWGWCERGDRIGASCAHTTQHQSCSHIYSALTSCMASSPPATQGMRQHSWERQHIYERLPPPHSEAATASHSSARKIDPPVRTPQQASCSNVGIDFCAITLAHACGAPKTGRARTDKRGKRLTSFSRRSWRGIFVVHLVRLLVFGQCVGLGAVEDRLVRDGPLAITDASPLHTQVPCLSTDCSSCAPILQPLVNPSHPAHAHTGDEAPRASVGGQVQRQQG